MKSRADRPNAGRVSVNMAYVNTTNLIMFKINMSIRHMSGRGGQLGPVWQTQVRPEAPMSRAHARAAWQDPTGTAYADAARRGPMAMATRSGATSRGPLGRRPTTTNFTWSCWLRSFRIAARLDLPMPGVARIRFPAGRVSARHR